MNATQITVTDEAKKFLDDAISRVQSKSVRDWANSEHNRPIMEKIAQGYINKGIDVQMMAIFITSEAIGLW